MAAGTAVRLKIDGAISGKFIVNFYISRYGTPPITFALRTPLDMS
jgi:hypothetical protein